MTNSDTNNKKSILVICPFPQNVAAGQRLKYEQYFSHWEENGYEVTVSSFMNDSMWKVIYLRGHYFKKIVGTFVGYLYRFRDLFRIPKYDIVYVFQWITPFGFTMFERAVRLLSKKLIYDIEDNAIVKVSSSINKVIYLLKNPNKNKYLIKRSDYVITSSPTLNDYCLKLNDQKKCKYISSSVNVNRFLPVNLYNNKKTVTIGWTGTFSSKEYLDTLRPVFIELRNRCNFKLFVIGNFEYEFNEIDLEVVQWSRDNEVKDMQKIDIGVYPLINDEWVFGKSGLKAIQYMSFGLPTVATNIGTTPSIIENMKNGILVKTDSEWVDNLEMLINNSELRRRIGREARKTIVNRFSTDIISADYLSIIKKLV